MISFPRSFLGFALLAAVGMSATANDQSTTEIDAQIWQLISRTVAENDIDGMASAYHPDAVLVSANGTARIDSALAKWGKDMETMKSQGSSAEVLFRLSSRQDGEETAFESGMFRYVLTGADGSEDAYIIAFEALLVKTDGQWKLLMERQLHEVSEEEWSAP